MAENKKKKIKKIEKNTKKLKKKSCKKIEKTIKNLLKQNLRMTCI